jgi:hypothetical protein
MNPAMTNQIGVAAYHRFQQLAHAESVVFYYSGYFNQTMVSAMGEALRLRISYLEANNVTRRRVFSVFVELAQNIVHYSADALSDSQQTDREVRRGAIWIGEQEGHFYVVCANPVLRSAIGRIRDRLEPLCAMSMPEIKSQYSASLRREQQQGSKGAGLGFLTVARDASGPIEFDFVDEYGPENPTTLFYLKALI